MRIRYLLGGLVMLAACDTVAPPGADCGASSLQVLIGRPSVDLVKFIATQPKYVQDNAYYLGETEAIGPEVPKNGLIARVSTDHVSKPADLLGTRIVSLTCNAGHEVI